jgi:hypothetical protein
MEDAVLTRLSHIKEKLTQRNDMSTWVPRDSDLRVTALSRAISNESYRPVLSPEMEPHITNPPTV